MINAKQLYDSLLSEYSNTQIEYHRKIDTNNQTPIYAGVTEDKVPFFMFEVASNDVHLIQVKVPSCSCFEVSKGYYSNECYRWKLVAKTNSTFDIFYVVISDLIERSEETKEAPIQAIIDRIILWTHFFKKTINGVLEYKKQIGLFGELLFIRECLSNNNQDVIKNWTGPYKRTKDFVFSDTAVEIKTSVQSDTNRIPISDENQLDGSGFHNLFLNYRQITPDQLDGDSIPELIDEIIEAINSQEDKTLFINALLQSGYSEQFRNLYDNRFSSVNSFFFRIDDSFPSIIPSKIDNGIKYVSYEIEFSMITDHIVPDLTAFNTIR